MYVPKDSDIQTRRLVWGKSGYVELTQLKSKPQFVKGPIPLHWLCTAAQLPGKALHVGVWLWYMAGVSQSKEVVLSNARVTACGISRHQKARGLTALERAGLVEVKRVIGRNPSVRIINDK